MSNLGTNKKSTRNDDKESPETKTASAKFDIKIPI